MWPLYTQSGQSAPGRRHDLCEALRFSRGIPKQGSQMRSDFQLHFQQVGSVRYGEQVLHPRRGPAGGHYTTQRKGSDDT